MLRPLVILALAGSSPAASSAQNGAKGALEGFHGVHILDTGLGDVSCDGPGRILGPFAEPAVVFVHLDAVEQNGDVEAKHGIRMKVLAGDQSVIDTRGTPESEMAGSTTSIATGDHFYLARGRAVELRWSVCPTGDMTGGRNITSHMYFIAVAAAEP